MTILDIQTALKAQGFDPGDLDGEWGRRTIAAVRAFQSSKGLEVDGIVGPQTLGALNGAKAPKPGAADAAQPGAGAPPLVWFEEALSLVGTKEQPGPGSNERIINWAKNCNLDYASDDIPWCGLFVSHCVAATLPEEPLPKSPLLARSWRKFGDPASPVQGAILVFWRGSRDGSSGHVGFYRGEDDEAYHVLGGNQSDSVSTCRVSKARLLEARWPHSAASLHGMKVAAGSGNQMLSHNEA